jgi:hypothetical protein
MATIFDRTASAEATAHAIALPRRHDDRWARSCATGGAAVWAALAVLAGAGKLRMGGIELLFLFAPLVVVPLGISLGRGLEFLSPSGSVRGNSGARAIDCFISCMQPVAAVSAVIALLLPPGRAAGLWACPWLFLGLLLGTSAVAGSISARASRRVPLSWEWALRIAKIDLLVGGVWFLISRLGIRPLRFAEPIGLLTAVHFHFAGFATAMIAAAAGQFAARRPARSRLRFLIPVVVGMPFVVALGFVTLPALKMAAALLFGLSLTGLAVWVRSLAKTLSHRTARVLLEVASASVFAAMVLAGAYAIADFLGSDRLTMPQMARTHGVLNGVGFCLPGLLAWLVEMEPAAERRE